MKQYEILNCPFCNENTISCIFFPSATKIRIKSSATFGKSKEKTKSSEEWVIQSGCSKCRKSQEEVEKELKNKGVI